MQYTTVDEAGKKQRISRLFDTKTAGKKFLQELRHGAKVAGTKVRKELTVGGWFDWLAANDWPDELSEATVSNRKGRFNIHVRATFGDVPLTKVDPLKIRAFYKHLKDKGVGAATVLEIKRDLVRVFNQARTPYQRVPFMSGNPFALTVPTPPRRTAVALTPEEARKALESKHLSNEERGMLAVFLLAGLRLSEQMALTVEQIRFDQNLIFIDRSVKVGAKGRQTIGLPKGDKQRLVVLCPTLKHLLLAMTDDRADNQYLWSAGIANQPKTKKVVYTFWDAIRTKAGQPTEMTPHDCRLTHINWIEKLMPEVSPTTLKEHVGHSATGVTEVNYTRPLTTSQQILRDNLERIINPATVAQTPSSAPSGAKRRRVERE